MTQFRTVSVSLPLPVRKNFSYRVPESLPVPALGARVRVPFGERVLTGLVVPGEEEQARVNLREVFQVLDDEPVCPAGLYETARKVADRFFASTGEVLKAALPTRLPAAGTVRYRVTERGALTLSRAEGLEREVLEQLSGGEAVRILDLPGEGRERRETLRSLEERGWIRAVATARAKRRRGELAYLPRKLPEEERPRRLGRSRKGGEVLAYLDSIGRPASAAELRFQIGVGRAILRGLASRGLLVSFEQSRRGDREPGTIFRAEPRDFRPNREQAAAIEQIQAAIRERRYFPALLQGVTGSGKTEVYLRAISTALDAGRGALWLVPEIALTPVFARRLRERFGDRASVLHSALSERERAEAWDKVRAGEVSAVIGPRSAAFAPLQDPGVIVVDEEHDSSYKQRESPRYDARDVAALRARQSRAALLLGSATPSMEAYHAARTGRMALLQLTSRVEDRPLPEVEIVDLRRELPRPDEKGVPLFSEPLRERLREVFSRGEQAILLQPRRGYAPFLLCRDCGFDFRCSRCSVCRTVHGRGLFMLCHYCGERISRPERCPDCGGLLLEAIGAGTERVADRFAEIFPEVPYSILDRDTARRRGAGTVLDEVISGKVSCLIGTQMVAKGHDFPRVTSVGVLSADTLLNFPDFRAAERTFQLVAQVAGRAGRGELPGTVHVQSFHPDHPAIRRAAEHDVDGFASSELEFRRAFFYPPFSELAAILVASRNREKAEAAAAEMGQALSRSGAALRVSGPAPAPLERLQGKWRFQILLRASQRREILSALEESIPERPPSGVQIAVDVDPQDLM